MQEVYGHKWSSAYGEAAEVDGIQTGCAETWGKGLGGLTAQHMAIGLKACIRSADPWPPTLPAFRAMCLDVPSLLRVETAVRDGETADGFLALVWRHLDAYAYRQANASAASKLVAAAYERAREHVMCGGDLPEAPKAIAHEAPKQPEPLTEDSRARIKREMAEKRRELGLGELEELLS